MYEHRGAFSGAGISQPSCDFGATPVSASQDFWCQPPYRCRSLHVHVCPYISHPFLSPTARPHKIQDFSNNLKNSQLYTSRSAEPTTHQITHPHYSYSASSAATPQLEPRSLQNTHFRMSNKYVRILSIPALTPKHICHTNAHPRTPLHLLPIPHPLTKTPVHTSHPVAHHPDKATTAGRTSSRSHITNKVDIHHSKVIHRKVIHRKVIHSRVIRHSRACTISSNRIHRRVIMPTIEVLEADGVGLRADCVRRLRPAWPVVAVWISVFFEKREGRWGAERT